MTFIFLTTNIFSQKDTELNKIIDNFANVEDMPYICEGMNNELTVGCGDSIFWAAIEQGENIIPYLLDRISDSTKSKAFVPNFGGYFRIGDISLFALQVLIWDIPILDLAEDSINSEPRNGFWGYWNYTRRSYENRHKFKDRVLNWYELNKYQLEWIEGSEIKGCDCSKLKNPAGGHLERKESLAIFIGIVRSIERENLKEGTFDLITFKVDSIVKFDTEIQFKDNRYLNKTRKTAIVLDEPSKHNFEIGIKYIVYLDCCNVDYYISNQKLTKRIE